MIYIQKCLPVMIRFLEVDDIAVLGPVLCAMCLISERANEDDYEVLDYLICDLNFVPVIFDKITCEEFCGVRGKELR